MLRRKHLNDFQKAELAIPLLEIKEELARQRHRELSSKLVGKIGNSLASDDANVLNIFPTVEQKGKTVELVPKRLVFLQKPWKGQSK